MASYSKHKYKHLESNSFRKQNKICSFEDKICYTKKEAQTALNYTKYTNRDKVPIRYYYCNKCNMYHLTSQELRNAD